MKEDNSFIERRIITGLIVSTDYLDKVRKSWNPNLLGSKTARHISQWCIEFYDKYQAAPGKEIESIYLEKTKGFKEADKEDIEDIIASLSDEYEHVEKFNVDYLLTQTLQYFDEVTLKNFVDDLTQDLDDGNVLEAKKKAYEFSPEITTATAELDLSSEEKLREAISRAFGTVAQPVVTYPRQLGEMLNTQLVRGAFVAFMGPEKRGKTFFMMDMGIRAANQKANVAFFQAGDMTESQQLMRMMINLTGKSNLPEYSGVMYEPVRDCTQNQLDLCRLPERECNFGPFEGKTEHYLRNEVTYNELLTALKENKDYKPCTNCSKYWKSYWGTPWLEKVDTGKPLTEKEAQEASRKFFIQEGKRFRLSVHTSGTLTVNNIESILNLWERKDGFVPDLILVDFADILASDNKGEFRHQENEKWMKLRALSQKKHALVVTATWTDAGSYDKELLSLKNFSEDKRKYGHVTAMYGLNMDPKGREKEIGILRINQIVIREAAFLNSTVVHVLQNLRRGRPALSSYW
jgi:replicative DNA helicase